MNFDYVFAASSLTNEISTMETFTLLLDLASCDVADVSWLQFQILISRCFQPIVELLLQHFEFSEPLYFSFAQKQKILEFGIVSKSQKHCS